MALVDEQLKKKMAPSETHIETNALQTVETAGETRIPVDNNKKL